MTWVATALCINWPGPTLARRVAAAQLHHQLATSCDGMLRDGCYVSPGPALARRVADAQLHHQLVAAQRHLERRFELAVPRPGSDARRMTMTRATLKGTI